MIDVFIIGSKGLPAKYGGFETFVEKLTENRKNMNIKYHVACMSENNEEFIYNDARCFNVKVKNIGSAKAVLYDIKSIIECEKYIKMHQIKNPIIYILACRIGPFLQVYKSKLKREGIRIFINPDGNEWKRSKWNYFIKCYWKFSERLMVKNAELLICDSLGIQDYIKQTYKKYNPKTIFVAYGADTKKSVLKDSESKFYNWNKKYNISRENYYLIVGRFVPENNYETMIKEFINSNTKRDLVIITNKEQNKFYNFLLKQTNFKDDNRIKFAGTVYDKELLKKIRENAYCYIHGHEVGGTNPSLLEALASTKINLLLDVCFNREVGQSGAMYFSKEKGNLSSLINKVDLLEEEEIEKMSIKAKKRISEEYSWNRIVNSYENIFLGYK